jgi:hypothetical protein
MLATLEDRRLMTGGLNSVAAATAMPLQAYAEDVATHDATPRTAPAYVWDDTASSQDWIPIGSDAQFGSEGAGALSGGNAWPMPATPPGTSADASTPQGKMDAAYAKLWADMQAVQDKSEVTPRLLAALRSAREKATSEAGTPDASLLGKFQEGVAAVRTSGTFTDAQQAQLQADFTAALKSAGVPDGTIAELFAAQDAVRVASHVTADDLKTLAEDQAAIQAALDAMPRDPGYYQADLAASARGGNAVTAYSAAKPGAKAAAVGASIGKLPQGAPTPGREVSAASTPGMPVAARPTGFDPAVQFARLSRRMTTATSGRVRSAVETVGANTRRLALNAQAIPSTLARKAPSFQGMRTAPTTTRP